jgi:hypothetical protein
MRATRVLNRAQSLLRAPNELRRVSAEGTPRAAASTRDKRCSVDTFLIRTRARRHKDWLSHHLREATAELGDEAIGELDALAISTWRAALPRSFGVARIG